MTDGNDDVKLEPAPDEVGLTEFVDRAGKKRTFSRGSEDAEQADWLARGLERKVRFNYASDAWHVWNGLRWKPDGTKDVQRMVYDLVYERLAAIGAARMNEDKRKRALRIIRRMLERNRCESALDVLATLSEYKTDGSDWDQEPYLLGVANGIIDLRTGTLSRNPDSTMLV